jgi:hypothetical protein
MSSSTRTNESPSRIRETVPPTKSLRRLISKDLKASIITFRKNSKPEIITHKSEEVRIEKKIDSIYGATTQSTGEEHSQPVGFFGLFSSPNNDTFDAKLLIENANFFHNWDLFQPMYPELPIKVARTLIFRFSANFKDIIGYLTEKGWSANCLENLSLFKNEEEKHFSTWYYLGNHSCAKVLSNSPPGTFFTYYEKQDNYTQYYMKYKVETGQVIRKKISGPRVTEAENFLGLKPLHTNRTLNPNTFLPYSNMIN